MITITLNGEKTEVEANSTVTDLLLKLGLNREGIAVAIDQRVIPKSEHATFRIPASSCVEVIRAVGGG